MDSSRVIFLPLPPKFSSKAAIQTLICIPLEFVYANQRHGLNKVLNNTDFIASQSFLSLAYPETVEQEGFNQRMSNLCNGVAIVYLCFLLHQFPRCSRNRDIIVGRLTCLNHE